MKYNSVSHNILLLSKFYNKSIQYSDCKIIMPKINLNKDFSRCLLRLAVNGLIQFTNDHQTQWIITPKGIALVYDMPKKKPKTYQD